VQTPPLHQPKLTPTIELIDISINMNIKRIVEAILFAANRPMTIKQIIDVFPEIERPDTIEVQDAVDAIIQDYQERPVELKKVASGFRFQVRPELSRWVSRLFEEKPPRYSRALLETLAIIAYRQPVTRGDIEEIRGVAVSTSIVHTLLEREWIKIVAHKETPGHPALYGTSKQFLDYFNITSLNDLPTLQELHDIDFTANIPEQLIQEENDMHTIDNQDELMEIATANQEAINEISSAI
jgi:segregation and condensation protein B